MFANINEGKCYPVMPDFICDPTAKLKLQTEGILKQGEESGWILMSEKDIFAKNIPYDAVDWDCPMSMNESDVFQMSWAMD